MTRPTWVLFLTTLVLLPGSPCPAETPARPRESGTRLFQPPRRPPLPVVADSSRTANPIDTFLQARLQASGLTLSPPADRLRLLRRVTFDLTGLPPTLQEQEAFLADTSADAYPKVVDRLLASPRYGERWAQHFLDLVRYAESDGFKADDLRPNAYKYRDYIIRAFNADLPYDRFIRQQLAGDELEPDNPEALLATGYLRLWPDEYNAANLEQRRQEILDDVTDTTGLVFLGMTFECARCHDHKYDPITQKDYFRLQAFFAPMQPRDDLPLADPAARQAYHQKLAAWEATTKDVRAEIEALVAGKRAELRKHALDKFRTEIKQAVLKPDDKRTPYERQIALIAEKQLQVPEATVAAKLSPESKKRYQELERKLAAVKPGRPEPLPTAMAVTDIGPVGPEVHRLAGGDWRKPKEKLDAGFPEFLGAADTVGQAASLPSPGKGQAGSLPYDSTGLRAGLARWLTRPDHPLTARVLVNRLWQHHFGVGLVPTSSDFGNLGEPVTHPELLDWLAVELVEHGWSLKHIHRLMVTSAGYCQDSRVNPDDPAQQHALQVDPNNQLLWHARRRRLEGESLRDSMLALSGDLNPRMFGPSARPRLPDKISKYAWKPDERVEDQNRRSIYVMARRNMRFPLFDAFDLPDMHNSCSRRVNTTTAPQALLLLNGDFTLEHARKLGADLLAHHGNDDAALVTTAYRAAWNRPATTDELRLGLRFLGSQTARYRSQVTAPSDPHGDAVVDLVHALLNTNEFLYAD